MTAKLLLVKNSPVKKEMWDGVLSWCNSQFFCRQSSRRSFACQDEFFVNNPIDVKDNYEHALDFAL
jgi:hypothetical protein